MESHILLGKPLQGPPSRTSQRVGRDGRGLAVVVHKTIVGCFGVRRSWVTIVGCFGVRRSWVCLRPGVAISGDCRLRAVITLAHVGISEQGRLGTTLELGQGIGQLAVLSGGVRRLYDVSPPPPHLAYKIFADCRVLLFPPQH